MLYSEEFTTISFTESQNDFPVKWHEQCIKLSFSPVLQKNIYGLTTVLRFMTKSL